MVGTLNDAVPAEVRFTTSGTTGPPVAWRRTRDQLVAEAEILAGLVRDEGIGTMLTYASDQHLYGYLFNRLVSGILGLPVRRTSVTEPLPALSGGLLVVAVPSAWWQLGRSVPRLRSAGPVTVVHSTAALPQRAGELLAQLPCLRLCELHGSTETGLVGFRHAADDDWTLAQDVAFADDDTDRSALPRPLRVRGPRLARRETAEASAEHTLDDTVVHTGPRTYRLIGRRGRLVKVDGHRVDVSRMERDLHALLGVRVTVRTFRDELRGEWYEILVPGGEQQRRTVLRAVSSLVPAAHQPRTVRSLPGTAPTSAREQGQW